MRRRARGEVPTPSRTPPAGELHAYHPAVQQLRGFVAQQRQAAEAKQKVTHRPHTKPAQCQPQQIVCACIWEQAAWANWRLSSSRRDDNTLPSTLDSVQGWPRNLDPAPSTLHQEREERVAGYLQAVHQASLAAQSQLLKQMQSMWQ